MVLEGGYNARVLAECVCAALPALAGKGSAGEQAELGPGEERLRAEAAAQVRPILAAVSAAAGAAAAAPGGAQPKNSSAVA